MEKPASIRRVELRNKIVSDINAAKLPPYVTAQILESVLLETNRAIERQYRADMQTWEEAQRKEAEDAEERVSD